MTTASPDRAPGYTGTHRGDRRSGRSARPPRAGRLRVARRRAHRLRHRRCRRSVPPAPGHRHAHCHRPRSRRGRADRRRSARVRRARVRRRRRSGPARRASSPATPTAGRGGPRSRAPTRPTRCTCRTHARPSSRCDRASTSTNGAPRLEHGLAAIDAGEIEKVVLAREVDIEADAPFDVVDILDTLARDAARLHRLRDRRFRRRQPGAPRTARTGATSRRARWPVPGDDPAALLALDQGRARAPDRRRRDRGGAARPVRPRSAAKGRPPSASPTSPTSRRRSAAGSRIRDVVVTDLVESLHPTPAVGGWPAQPRRWTMIRTLEGHDRGRYAGACGWVDANGDGEFVVALRCAQIDGAHARLYAGAGIVAGSEPRLRSGPRRRPSCSRCCGALVRP